MNTENKPRKKYVCIAKVDNGVNSSFVKYRCNDLQNFIQFITKRYNVFYFNAFSNTGTNRGLMMFTWGSKKGLQPAT